jgi:PIN domain nuclease of toxin-antitoxin system
MKLLLDAHALIWAVDNPVRLGRVAAEALRDPANELFLSAGSIWEISIKVGIRKLDLSMPFGRWMAIAAADLGATLLPISIEHAEAQMHLPSLHGDPFDRLLAAQANVERLKVVSGDTIFDAYGVERLWDEIPTA